MPQQHVVLVEWTRTAAVGGGFVLALFEHLGLTEQLSPWRSSSVVTFAVSLPLASEPLRALEAVRWRLMRPPGEPHQ